MANNIVGTRIKELMAREGVLQKDLAKTIGISQASISQMLNTRDVRFNTVERMASALGYDIEFVSREEARSRVHNPVAGLPGAELLTKQDYELLRTMAKGLISQKEGN